jgi:pentatricopeptide repeat protein
MLHLTGIWRDRLLNIMGLPPKRDSDSMMRYFALVADVKSAGLTLTQRQWNHALTFAATYAAKASTTEMESTMRLWREMERGANVKGNEITFNILFDVAAKAGNFALADMIFKEMVNRGFGFNRFHHVSLIFYFGLRLDSGGVRAAYREMVKAGEMVDTVALNAVISGLLRCGEEDAANETYQRMRHSQPLFNKVPRPPKDNSTEKVVSRALMMFSKLAKTYPSMRINFQAGVDISPNIRTYKLLIEHYALRIGSLKHVAQYLDEMMLAGIRPHPTIFLAIFKAFKWHGGFPGSEWSNEHLQMMLSAMFQAQKEMKDDFRIEHWIVLWALRAVKKCGSPESVEETFQSLSECWTIPEDRVPYTHSFFESILDGSDEQRAHRSRARRNLGAA